MEHLLILFFATFAAAFLATVPPGLLNMNAAKVSVEKGKRSALVFSLGITSMIMVQAYVAVAVSRFLHQHPEVVSGLMKVALFVFGGLAIYFFYAARKGCPPKERKERSPSFNATNLFVRGFLLAALNLLTIPYYSGLHVMWKASGWIQFQWTDILVFVMSGGLGSFFALYLYTVYFTRMERKKGWFSRKSNYILSVLMLVLLVITLFRIFNQ